MDPIKAYQETRILPDDQVEARRIERRSTKFILHEEKLLRKSITNTEMHPFLQCLRPEDVELAFQEIHEGMCEVAFLILQKSNYTICISIANCNYEVIFLSSEDFESLDYAILCLVMCN